MSTSGPTPHGWANDVNRMKILGEEEVAPIILPLLVNVVGATLARNGGTEKDSGSGRSKAVHERAGTLRRQVLSDLKPDSEIKMPFEPSLFAEVGVAKA